MSYNRFHSHFYKDSKMKRFIALIICALGFSITLCLRFTGTVLTVSASGEYLRVITADTLFYRDENMTELLFYLPYTYYVKVLNINGDVAHIEYSGDYAPAVDGYADKNALFSDGLTVGNPYPALSVKTCKTATLYEDAALSQASRYIFAERSLYYYGYVKNGDDFIYFVSYGGNLGYVEENCLYPFTVPDHPNELTFLITDKNDEQTFAKTDYQKKDNAFVLRIIIIGCLVFAGLIAAFSVRKPKNKNTGSYYDENDFS